MSYLSSDKGKDILLPLCDIIIENKVYLSEIDGAIGDGDHGINMAKGFSICKEKLESTQGEVTLSHGFSALANVLMGSIGGSMGPLYGSIFFAMSDSVKSCEKINAEDFAKMIRAGLTALQGISDAQVGDKCLMDTIVPSVVAFEESVLKGESFAAALNNMSEAAEFGRDSTKALVAKVGRASRLGERSKGVLDAGAVSCCMLFSALANEVINNIN